MGLFIHWSRDQNVRWLIQVYKLLTNQPGLTFMVAAVQATFTTSYLHTILIYVVGKLLLICNV